MEKINLILSSSSQNRKELLYRLKIPFSCISPEIDESPLEGESPVEVGRRLARLKAEKTAEQLIVDNKINNLPTLIIGSDQVAFRGKQMFEKPITRDKAIAQLQLMQGKNINFWTALHVIKLEKDKDSFTKSGGVMTNVNFRKLSIAQIEKYVDIDNPLTCAGSARCESLGIALLSSVESNDPTALIGLPLIMLTSFIQAFGYEVL